MASDFMVHQRPLKRMKGNKRSDAGENKKRSKKDNDKRRSD